MADQPGELAYVWNRVIADLSGTSAGSGASALSAQQRAFLRLTRPLGLIDGTALLAAPSEFAKDAIERILRRPISEALGRHLGFTVNLAVVVDVDAASGGTEVPDPPGTARPQPAPEPAPPGFAEPDGAMFPATRPDAPAPVDEELLVPVGGQPRRRGGGPAPDRQRRLARVLRHSRRRRAAATRCRPPRRAG